MQISPQETKAVSAHLASLGQDKDTMLVHMSKPEYQKMVETLGFKGKLNPKTGLPSFAGGGAMGGVDFDAMAAQNTARDVATATKAAGEKADTSSMDRASAEASAKINKMVEDGQQEGQTAGSAATAMTTEALSGQITALQSQVEKMQKMQGRGAKNDDIQNTLNGIGAMMDGLGFVSDHLLSKDIGDSLRSAGSFVRDAPNQFKKFLKGGTGSTATQENDASAHEGFAASAMKFINSVGDNVLPSGGSFSSGSGGGVSSGGSDGA